MEKGKVKKKQSLVWARTRRRISGLSKCYLLAGELGVLLLLEELGELGLEVLGVLAHLLVELVGVLLDHLLKLLVVLLHLGGESGLVGLISEKLLMYLSQTSGLGTRC